MVNPLRSRKTSAFILVILAFACMAALGLPRPYLNSELGADWRCRKTAWIFTTCVPPKKLTPSERVAL